MESIKEIFKIGYGPSSSHTMGPRKAAKTFLAKIPEAEEYVVTLYGSLAATGKGHLTGMTIKDIFAGKNIRIVWEPTIYLPRHPNALKFEAFNKGLLTADWTAYSIGGGSIVDDESEIETHKIYDIHTMTEIMQWCFQNGATYWQFVEKFEGPEIWDYLTKIWIQMQKTLKKGLLTQGTLPGGLSLPRKASQYSAQAKNLSGPRRRMAQLYSYALAVSEENAAGGKIVTAPTCGSCGALPAVLYYLQGTYKADITTILHALATAGLFGNIVKTNASISGAAVGCQGEVGVACAMASAAACQIYGGSIYQIEYAAEIGIEHSLGLTCDPVLGLVQIPCIERNVFAAARALDNASYTILSDGRHRISFDEVTETLKQTGCDLSSKYRETSKGGLALMDAFPIIY